MVFFCVNDGVPTTTVRLLRQACEARGLDFQEVDARAFDFAEGRRLGPGALLYRPAASLSAARVEQYLWSPQVASFYAAPEAVFSVIATPPLLFESAGLPIPRTVYCSTTERRVIEAYVERLGGFPIVVKILGYQSGVGVMQVDSYPALLSLLDFALAQGHNPLLSAFIGQAVHWRLIVLGGQVIAAYQNTLAANDFRTYAPLTRASFETTPSTALASVAVRAIALTQKEFGGVDLLEQAGGSVYLLETNSPCYFAPPQEIVGIDVSGQMVDYLSAKARRLQAPGQ